MIISEYACWRFEHVYDEKYSTGLVQKGYV